MDAGRRQVYGAARRLASPNIAAYAEKSSGGRNSPSPAIRGGRPPNS
jgi:hypothetical protein